MELHGIEIETKCGPFFVVEDGNGICRADFCAGDRSEVIWQETPLLKKARLQLTEYFQGKRRTFDLPLSTHGTDFQERCWAALREIPYGETRTYGQIARAIGCPKGCRAVGMANNRNPVGVITPCHRVIGADGSLTGYAGGLDKKKMLLDLERDGHPVGKADDHLSGA